MDLAPTRPGGAAPGTGPVPAVVPPVVAVLVTHDPGEWFEEALASFAAQTYPDLSVLVIDNASTDDPTERITAVLPEAHVHRREQDLGFGAAVNEVVDLVDGAAFFALCHDDVALEPDTIRSLVEEAFRSNAGIIGPKLVDWDDPRRLLQVGMSIDKTGALAPIVERGELDQEQHDAVRDVFVVPGGVTVIRADLFTAIGGFDDAIRSLGDDVSLCWRAHAVGARVLIAPAARVRHVEALGRRDRPVDRRRQLARARLRNSLINYGPWHRMRVLPQAAFFTVIEAVYAVVSGHPGKARDVLGAWPWNLRRMGAVRRRRRALDAVRHVNDREIRDLQVRGSARMSTFLRGPASRRDDRISTLARSSRDLAGSVRDSGRQLTGALAVVIAVLLLLGSRGLLTGPIPAISEFARFPSSPGPLLDTWWSGWRRAGLGSAGAQPTGDLLIGVLGYVFFGAMGLLRAVLILGTIPLGALGAWRLTRPVGSVRASVAAFVVYLAIPVPYNALARGSWSGLALYAISPWILLVLGRASGAAPFGPVGAEPGARASSRPRRSLASQILGLGLALAVIGALVPFVLVVVVALTLALAVGSLLVARSTGIGRLLAVGVGATAVAVALNLPWGLDLLRSPSVWDAVAGAASPNGGALGLGRILRFETGPWGAPPLGWAFLGAAGLPIIIGRSWRLDWAVRAWAVAVGGWTVLWLAEAGDLPVGLPAAEVVLAPVAASLALAAALGLAAFETDLRAYRFGWRQILSVVAALGVLLGAIPLGSGLIDGRWKTPSQDYVSSLGNLLSTRDRAPFRVLWIGDPQLLPAAGWRYDDDVTYVTTDRGTPTVADRFASRPAGATPLVADAIRLAEGRRTDRLGRLLAPMGIRYVILPSRLAPDSPTVTRPSAKAVVDLDDHLSQQLDLESVPVTEGMVVYRNRAWVPTRAVLPPRDGDQPSFTDAATDDLRGARAALRRDDGNTTATGSVPAPGDLLVASTADDGWRLRIDGVVASHGETYGWANQFAATSAGPARLTYDTPLVRHLLSGAQALGWIVAFVAWRVVRRRERRPALATTTGSVVT